MRSLLDKSSLFPHAASTYSNGADPLRYKLGEPTSFTRESKISFLVQASSVVEEAGTGDEDTHLMEVGSLSSLRGAALLSAARQSVSFSMLRQEPLTWGSRIGTMPHARKRLGM